MRRLYHDLKEAGYHPWLDKYDLLPGQKWREEIERIICDPYNLVVVCLSDKSITKRGVVQQEIRWALDMLDQMPEGAIFLIPARLEPCQVPDRLSNLHWVDLFEPDGFVKLRQALDFEIRKRQPERGPAPKPPPPPPTPVEPKGRPPKPVGEQPPPRRRPLWRVLAVVLAVLVLSLMLPIVFFTVLYPRLPNNEANVSFLPLAVGNTWTYTRTVMPGKMVQYLITIPEKKGNADRKFAAQTCDPGTYDETYLIDRQEKLSDGTSTWRIKIDSPEAPEGCQGRYHEAQQIHWYAQSTDMAGADAEVFERITYDSSVLRDHDLVDPTVQTRNFLIEWETLGGKHAQGERLDPDGTTPPDDYPTFTIATMVVPAASLTMFSEDAPWKVTTPAGSFDECIEAIEYVQFDEAQSAPIIQENFGAGWVTYRYFCRGVGLVKEIQREWWKGEAVTYILELKSFNICKYQRQLCTIWHKLKEGVKK